jgi:uncharacterized membrane protein YbhN (UPF0104 family)
VAWRVGRWLLAASLLPIALGVFFLVTPVTNPGVQDCGAPFAYSVTGRGNTRVAPSVNSPGADATAALRAQTPCSERVDSRLRQATWSIAVFIVLAGLGAVLGLVDDRLRLRGAPRFEQLLRERPAGAPGAVWDRPVVPVEDIGSTLPDIESSDVESFVVWSVVTLCVLFIVSGVGDALDAMTEANVLPVLAAIVLVVLMRVSGGAQLALIEAGLNQQRDRLVRAARVMIAADWAGRLRPAFGSIGVQAHTLVRDGVDRERSLVDMGAASVIAVVTHASLLGVSFIATIALVSFDGELPPKELLLILIVLAMAVAGVVMFPARVRRLPCTLGRATWRRFDERWRESPSEVAAQVGLAALLPVLEALVLVCTTTAVGGGASGVAVVFAALAGLAFGAFAPVPEGFVAADVVVVIILCLAGVSAIPAVAAVLYWRLLTVWLPLGPGFLMARNLVRGDAL